MGSDAGIFQNGNNHVLLILFVISISASAFCLILPFFPILVLGFFTSVLWISSFDETKSRQFLLGSLFLTFLVFYFLIGFPIKNGETSGFLFSDLHGFTKAICLKTISIFNFVLPRKLRIHSVSTFRVQVYLWLSLLVAIGSSLAIYILVDRKAPLFTLTRSIVRKAASNQRKLAVISLLVVMIVFLRILLLKGALIEAYTFVFISIAFFSTHLFLQAKLLKKIDASIADRNKTLRNSVLIGQDKSWRRRKFYLSNSQLNHHVEIVGASGFGKSVLLSHIIRSRIEQKSGMLFIDLKADFETIRQVVSISKTCGRVEDLQIFSVGNPDISTSYNVLASGSTNQLKDRIMGAFVWSEEFYKNEAESFLLKSLRVLVYLRENRRETFDLKSVLSLIEDPEMFRRLCSRIPIDEKELVEQSTLLADYLANPENRKALRGLKSQIESLVLSDFGHLLLRNEYGINLFNAVQQRKIVFVLLDSRTFGQSAASLGKLIIQDLKAMSARIDNEIARADRIPFTVVIDEFADLASEDFVGFLDRARSSKIGVVVAHQEIADLDRISPEFTRRLMNSTSTLFSFLQKLPDSSEVIASVSGTRKVEEVTEQAEKTILGNQRTGMRSIKVVDEFRIHPNILRSLQVGECVMISKYPIASSCIVSVRRETTADYLADDEVRNLLRELIEREIRFPAHVQTQIVSRSTPVF